MISVKTSILYGSLTPGGQDALKGCAIAVTARRYVACCDVHREVAGVVDRGEPLVYVASQVKDAGRAAAVGKRAGRCELFGWVAAELGKGRTRHVTEAHAKVVAAVIGSQIVGRRKAPHLTGLTSGAPLARTAQALALGRALDRRLEKTKRTGAACPWRWDTRTRLSRMLGRWLAGLDSPYRRPGKGGSTGTWREISRSAFAAPSLAETRSV